MKNNKENKKEEFYKENIFFTQNNGGEKCSVGIDGKNYEFDESGNVFRVGGEFSDLSKRYKCEEGIPEDLKDLVFISLGKQKKSREKRDKSFFLRSNFLDKDSIGRRMAYMFYSKNYSSLEDVIKTLRDYASAFKRELNETEIRKAMESVEENKKKKKRFGIILVIVSSILLGILISHMMEDSAEELREGENVEVYVEKGK
jgi:hypothetical protein